MRVGIIASEFNPDITDPMLQKAKEHVASLGAEVAYICRVPGAFDMPLMVQTLLERADVDGVITIGAVIQGETRHDEIVAQTAALKISDLALQYRKPVALGIAGPGMTKPQGMERIEEYARRSVGAAIKLVRRVRALEASTASKRPVVIE